MLSYASIFVGLIDQCYSRVSMDGTEMAAI